MERQPVCWLVDLKHANRVCTCVLEKINMGEQRKHGQTTKFVFLGSYLIVTLAKGSDLEYFL